MSKLLPPIRLRWCLRQGHPLEGMRFCGSRDGTSALDDGEGSFLEAGKLAEGLPGHGADEWCVGRHFNLFDLRRVLLGRGDFV